MRGVQMQISIMKNNESPTFRNHSTEKSVNLPGKYANSREYSAKLRLINSTKNALVNRSILTLTLNMSSDY